MKGKTPVCMDGMLSSVPSVISAEGSVGTCVLYISSSSWADLWLSSSHSWWGRLSDGCEIWVEVPLLYEISFSHHSKFESSEIDTPCTYWSAWPEETGLMTAFCMPFSSRALLGVEGSVSMYYWNLGLRWQHHCVDWNSQRLALVLMLKLCSIGSR